MSIKKMFHRIRQKPYNTMMLFALMMFLLYSFLYFPFVGILNSPDETSNYFFTLQFVEHNRWMFPLELNTQVGNILHPRSIFVFGEYLIPGSFLGLPLLYGMIGKILGTWIILFLTSIFTICAAFCFYHIIKKLFSQRIAYYSFFLFLLHPAIWFYTARSMMHNMLFIDLLIIGLYFLIVHTQKWWAYVLSGFFLSFSLATRTSEVIWMLFAALILYLFSFKQVSIKHLLLFFFSAALFFYPILEIHKSIYGHYCLSAYTCHQSVIQIGETSSNVDVTVPAQAEEIIEQSFWQRDILEGSMLRLIFPFGVIPERTIQHVWQYAFLILWYLIIPGILGFFLIWKTAVSKKVLSAYSIIFIGVSLFLFLYYGSWVFTDNINSWELSLGNSFARYFLPFYIFLIPFTATFLLYVKKYSQIVMAIFFGLICVLSFDTILWANSEGLLKSKMYLEENAQKKEMVTSIIDNSAILITERQDKLFFPEYLVVYDFYENRYIAEQVQELLKHRDVYYFTYRPLRDIKHINTTYLKDLEYTIEEKDVPILDQYLYKLQYE